MPHYIIAADLIDSDLNPVWAKFSLGFNNDHMAKVFRAVNDFENGQDIAEDDRAFHGRIYSSLESLVSTNYEYFTVNWLEGDSSKLSLNKIGNIIEVV